MQLVPLHIGDNDDWINASKVLKKGCDFISVANFGADPEVGLTQRTYVIR
jgi:hypothetical protein